MERIEVLRGPQGTLFGKNSTGGALRYITKKPQLDEVSGYVNATVGEYDRIDVKGAVNVPLTDTVAARISAASLSRDGYVERLSDGIGLGDEGTQFFQAQLLFQPSDRLTINVGMDYTQRDTDDGPTKLIDYHGYTVPGNAATVDSTPGGPLAVSPGSNAGASWNAQWGTTALVYDPTIPASLYQVGGEGRLSQNDVEAWGARMDLTYEINDNLTFRSLTGYREVTEHTIFNRSDQDGAYVYFDDEVKEGVDFWSQEVQLNGVNFDGRLNWVSGLYYSQEEPNRIDLVDRDGRFQYGVRGALMLNDTAEQTTDSFGFYFQGTYDITEQLALTGGVRYTRDEKDFSVSQMAVWDFELDALADQLGLTDLVPQIAGGGPGRIYCDPKLTPAGCVNSAPVTGGDTFSSVTPHVALEYQWNDDIMTYFAASKGFKSGGTNDRVADINTPFTPEELWSYEVGVRSELFDSRLRLNVTWFTMDYEDKQITVTVDPICSGRCTTNVGDAKIDGWEFEAIGIVTDAFQIHGALGLLDAEWDTIANATAGVGLNSEFSRAPDLSYNIGGRYTFNLESGANVVASLDFAYTDDQRSSPQDSTSLSIPEYELMNARVTYHSSDSNWEVSVFCNNCADEEYITGGATWAAATDNTHPQFNYKPSTFYGFTQNGLSTRTAPPGITIVNVSAPRMWGVSAQYNF